MNLRCLRSLFAVLSIYVYVYVYKFIFGGFIYANGDQIRIVIVIKTCQE